MDVGEWRVDGVVDGCFPLEPTQLYFGTAAEQWLPHRGLLDSDGRIGFTLGGFLIRGRGRVVLVDLGAGPRTANDVGYDGGRFLTSMDALGVSPDEVSDVVFTHLHFDHIGWAATGERATFPRATYRCHQADWEHFMERHPGLEREMLAAVVDRFDTWSGDATILPGIDARWSPGHTPGSVVIILSSGTERALLLGDVVHCPVELVDDDWDGIYDVDPGLAKRTRVALAREFEGTDVPMAAAHFPDLRFGRLLPAEGTRRWLIE